MIWCMAPIRPDLYDYSFDRAVLSQIRKKLALSQAKLASLLDIPVNTLSRWEVGTTTPDADALAAIYSIAKQHGVSPNFFKRRAGMEQSMSQRSKLVLPWDYQNLALEVEQIEDEWAYMKDYLDILFPRTRKNRVLRVYGRQPPFTLTYPVLQGQSIPTVRSTFEGLGFEVLESYFDADSQLARDSLQECRADPNRTVFILVSKDRDYSELLKELRRIGVEVYIWSREDETSQKLKTSVENGNLIPWDKPYVIVECVEVIKELKGQNIKRGAFGQRCRERLEKNDIYPQDVGFSQRNPYGSLLTWLERQGIVEVRTVKEPDLISVRMRT